MVMKFLSGMRRKHGKIFAFWPGNSPMVVVMEPKCVRQILTDTKTFVKGSDYSNKFAIVFGEGLVTSNGSKHRQDRSCLAKYFVRSGVENYMGYMVNTTKEVRIYMTRSKGRLERSNSKSITPPSHITDNLPLVASLLASSLIPTLFVIRFAHRR